MANMPVTLSFFRPYVYRAGAENAAVVGLGKVVVVVGDIFASVPHGLKNYMAGAGIGAAPETWPFSM